MPKAVRPAPSGPRSGRQVAALPWRLKRGRLELCLITTRETRRWTVPKGWPMKGLTDRRSAAAEAQEEAGLIGKAAAEPIGSYNYWKRGAARFDLIHVAVYPLEVRRALSNWKERRQRDVRWMSPNDARLLIDEPELMTLLGRFAEGFEIAAAELH